MQIKTKIIENLAVTTAKLANDSVSTAKIIANAVDGTKIRLANDQYLRGRNQADSGDINILKVNTSDEIETDGTWNFAVAPVSVNAPSSGSQLANKTYVDSVAGGSGTGGYEVLTLDSTDITNQYVDLAEEVNTNTLHVYFSGVAQVQGTDYTLSTEGGVTRITFAGDLATGGAAELVDGDVLVCQYFY